MGDSFGARLRSHREGKRLTLESIADMTKIKASLLEELERDDLSHWPIGLYARAYVRAYADAAGLDSSSIVREFVELHPESAEAPAVDPAEDRRLAARLRSLLNGAMPDNSRRRQVERQAEVPAIVNASAIEPLAETSVLAETGVLVEERGLNPEPSMSAIARVCARIGRALDVTDASSCLSDVAALLGAAGLVVWTWDPHMSVLRALVGHGYSDAVLAQLPTVRVDADNAIAAAFRAIEPRVVGRGDEATGALVVPLVAAATCLGVLAMELRDGREQHEWVSAVGTILASPLALLMRPREGAAVPAEASRRVS